MKIFIKDDNIDEILLYLQSAIDGLFTIEGVDYIPEVNTIYSIIKQIKNQLL